MLDDGDLLVLLTPVVAPSAPSAAMTSDPFEPLGRRLAGYHPWVRHVPYTARGGISSTHAGFIKRATAIIFVISGAPAQGQPSQVELFDVARSLAEPRPVIVITCCPFHELEPAEHGVQTVVQLYGYSAAELESAADLLFRERPPPAGPKVQHLILPPKSWSVEVWDSHGDATAVHELWSQCLPDQFRLDRLTLQSLLVRDGYAMHYVVREPGTREVLGFCATYTTYIDGAGERLIGSLSIIIVRPSSRQRGIGLSLHDHALRQLLKTRGVYRLQLGTTFPRLMYGFPCDMSSETWFRRRGWTMDVDAPGTGQEVCDWLLRLADWPSRGNLSTGLSFRPCTPSELEAVLHLVETESFRRGSMGWYDQYAKLANTMHVRDIIVGVEKDTIVASALTYTRNSGSPVADDIPWAATIGSDVGGVTCICVIGKLLLTVQIS
jgi:hypothetical protein